jgi:hypothetical protein
MIPKQPPFIPPPLAGEGRVGALPEKDHAQTKSYSGIMIRRKIIPL